MVSFNCFKFICKIAQLYVNEDGGWNVRATILVRRCHFPCFFNPLLHFWMDSNIPWIKIGKTLKHKKIQMFMNNLGCIRYNFTTSFNRKKGFFMFQHSARLCPYKMWMVESVVYFDTKLSGDKKCFGFYLPVARLERGGAFLVDKKARKSTDVRYFINTDVVVIYFFNSTDVIHISLIWCHLHFFIIYSAHLFTNQ